MKPETAEFSTGEIPRSRPSSLLPSPLPAARSLAHWLARVRGQSEWNRRPGFLIASIFKAASGGRGVKHEMTKRESVRDRISPRLTESLALGSASSACRDNLDLMYSHIAGVHFTALHASVAGVSSLFFFSFKEGKVNLFSFFFCSLKDKRPPRCVMRLKWHGDI